MAPPSFGMFLNMEFRTGRPAPEEPMTANLSLHIFAPEGKV
jgi:hypothetical protein